jgi:putative sigma-54 modulation protein
MIGAHTLASRTRIDQRVRTIVKGKNLEIAAADRRYAETKLRRLERMLDDRSEALVELYYESHRRPDTSHIVDVTLVIDGRPVHGTARAGTFREALDQVIDKLERRTVDHKKRPLESRKAAGRPVVAGDGRPDETPEKPAVVKVKRFAIEPMFEEDAVSQMEELGHAFFVFVNAENERLAVLYRRRDGDYGLIEPQIGGLYTRPTERATPQSVAVGKRRASGS